ncbi:MAG TPA: 3-deoxy-7-phosphoheptulonate synthase [Bacteriovoracaceae bacterium]|nr:3-deoxy-7-phosphoheptulonate synthase [Bacteriovoracaceae bacterium]
MEPTVTFRPHELFLIAGPCAVESENQMRQILTNENRPTLIRGGIHKMRTSSKSFQGMGDEGLEIVKKIKKDIPFDFVTEVTDARQIETLFPMTSIFQVGARNMYNYELLKELSRYGKPVILKRAFSATISEWLGASEYLFNLGEKNIILCERGVRSFDTKLRNLLDLGSVIYLKKNTPFKVLVDPSHSMGLTAYVADAAYAAVAAGADGLMVEVHPEPACALSDGQQALNLTQFNELVTKLKKLAPLFDKELRM